ncbi:MAG: ATP-binding protein [Candidatus Binatia bacterium]|nr:ATP-binding protein [Candidatus Binatia bacterium]
MLAFNAAAGIVAGVLLYQVGKDHEYLPPLFFAVSQALLWLYLGVSVLTCLRYRSGEFGPRTVACDILTTLAVLLWIGVATGGVASPVALLAGAKVAISGLMFGAATGAVAAGFASMFLGSFAAMNRLVGARAEELVALHGEFFWAYCLAYGVTVTAFVWAALHLATNAAESRVEAQRARRAVERERQALATTHALLRVSNAFSQLAEPRELLETALEVGRELLHADFGTALLWNEETRAYREVAASGLGAGKDELRGEVSGEHAKDLEWARSLGHCVIAGARIGFESQAGADTSVLLVPLKVENHFHGVLQFVRSRERPFTQYEIRLADGLGTQLALALERARLVEQSYRLLRAVESTGEGVLILDHRGRIQFANRAFLQVFGYDWEAVRGRVATDFAQPPALGWSALNESIVSRRHWRGEIEVRDGNGTLVPVRLHANSIVDPQGNIEGVVAIVEDVRAEKEIQEQLTRANRLAAAGELAAGLAHELNNALAAILSQTSMALSAATPDPALFKRTLDRIEGQARRMAGLVSAVLGFARPKPPQLQRVRLSELAQATVELFAPECLRRGVEMRVEDQSHGLKVEADPAQVQQVLMNLLTNALHALRKEPGGNITVRVIRAGDFGAIEVEDNGTGIPAELLPRIFDPFFTTKKAGTGLGLSVSYAIAREHRGNLTVHSQLGSGSTFRLELPVAQPASAAVRVVASSPTPVRHALVVDDDDLVATGLASMLEREGLQVERAASGQEAIDRCASRYWDAVFLDLRLPDISGLDVYRWLAEHRPDVARGVVFVSGGLWRGSGWRARLPDQPVLAKPCSAEELRAVLSTVRQLRDAA